MSEHSHALDHIEREENITFVIKICQYNNARILIRQGILSISFTSMSPRPRTVPGT